MVGCLVFAIHWKDAPGCSSSSDGASIFHQILIIKKLNGLNNVIGYIYRLNKIYRGKHPDFINFVRGWVCTDFADSWMTASRFCQQE